MWPGSPDLVTGLYPQPRKPDAHRTSPASAAALNILLLGSIDSRVTPKAFRRERSVDDTTGPRQVTSGAGPPEAGGPEREGGERPPPPRAPRLFYRVYDSDSIDGGAHVVDADDRGAAEDGGGDRRHRAVQPLLDGRAAEQRADEALAGGADEKGKVRE